MKKNDCNELIEFLNRVFTEHNGYEMHFEKLLPHIFCEDDKTMSYHIAAKKDSKICGCAGTYPMLYHISGVDIKAGVIENVAVDANYRNMGIMQAIMNQMNADNKAAGYDICFLQGDRKRYSHFGFDRCGVVYNFHITRSMLGKEKCENAYEYEVINKEDSALLKEAHKLYSASKTHIVKKPCELYYSLTANNHIPYAIISPDGKLEGCFCTDMSGTSLSNIVLRKKDEIVAILRKYIQINDMRVIYIPIPQYSEFFEILFDNCDRYQIYQPGCFKILNFKKIIQCYMREKNDCEELPDGRLTIDSDLFGKWEIKKDKDTITVSEFQGEAQIKLAGMAAYAFLFGTASPKCVGVEKTVLPLVKAWFPLPLYLPSFS